MDAMKEETVNALADAFLRPPRRSLGQNLNKIQMWRTTWLKAWEIFRKHGVYSTHPRVLDPYWYHDVADSDEWYETLEPLSKGIQES